MIKPLNLSVRLASLKGQLQRFEEDLAECIKRLNAYEISRVNDLMGSAPNEHFANIYPLRIKVLNSQIERIKKEIEEMEKAVNDDSAAPA